MRLSLRDIELGCVYRDAVHQQRGIAVSKLEHLTGSDRVELEWLTGNGEVSHLWLDVERLERVESEAPVSLPSGVRL